MECLVSIKTEKGSSGIALPKIKLALIRFWLSNPWSIVKAMSAQSRKEYLWEIIHPCLIKWRIGFQSSLRIAANSWFRNNLEQSILWSWKGMTNHDEKTEKFQCLEHQHLRWRTCTIFENRRIFGLPLTTNYSLNQKDKGNPANESN